jgi:ClpP class serine protease
MSLTRPLHWAMDGRHLRDFLPALASATHGHRIGLQAAPAAIPAPAPEQPAVSTSVAMLDLCGTMLPDAPEWLADFGLVCCDTTHLRAAIAAADADPAVQSIVLRIDSPGGAARGTDLLAAAVATCAKPITALVTGQCCSAAYWVAAQCDVINAVSRTCEIGSIGTYSVICDSSVAAESDGIRVHLISSGGIKGAHVDGIPVSADYLAAEQKIVDQLTALFVAGVNAGRECDLSALATGHTWLAEEAAFLGLIDGLADDHLIPKSPTATASTVAPTAAPAATAKETGMDLPTLTKLTAEHPAHAVQIVALAASGKSEAAIRSDLADLARRAEVESLNRQLAEAKANTDALALELANSKAAHAAELAAAQSAAVTAGKLATLAAGAPSDPGPGDAPDAKAPEFSSADAAAGKIPLALLQSGNYRIK